MPNGWEWAILILIALLLLGGARLSGVGRNVGRSIREFKDEIAVSRKPVAGELVGPEGGADPVAEAEVEAEPNIVVELGETAKPESAGEARSETDPA